MPEFHAKLSPSASSRWISCPASIQLEAAARAEAGEGSLDQESSFAREGTLAHSLGEITARKHFGIITKAQYIEERHKWLVEFNAEKYPEGTLEEMEGHVDAYVAYIQQRKDENPNTVVFFEERVDTGVEACWGTSDVVLVSQVHVEIIDLKYGAGVPVEAAGNSQLRLYGCGALDTFGDVLGTTETVTCSVFQPRLNNYDSETLEVAELRAWRDEVVKPAAAEALHGENPKFGPSEKACRWCPFAGTCRARIEQSVMEDFGDILADEEPPAPTDPPLITPEEMANVLKRVPQIKAWLGAVEVAALDMAYSQGKKIPGWKVVKSGGRRYVTDPTAAIQELIDAGYAAEQVADFKIKGFGVLEKLIPKDEFKETMGRYVAKSEGRESLVPESDKRTEISPASSAKDDFAVE